MQLSSSQKRFDRSLFLATRAVWIFSTLAVKKSANESASKALIREGGYRVSWDFSSSKRRISCATCLKKDWTGMIRPRLLIMCVRERGWRSFLSCNCMFSVDRCFQPKDFGDVVLRQLHIFSDASQCGYEAVTYLRVVNSSGNVHCSFLIGKSRQTPKKSVAIPRLKLSAAVVATRLNLIFKWCNTSYIWLLKSPSFGHIVHVSYATLPIEIGGFKPSSHCMLPSTWDLAQVIGSTWIPVPTRQMTRQGDCRLKSCVAANGGFVALTFCGRKNSLGLNSRMLWETFRKMIRKLREKRRQLLLRPKQTVKTTC